MTIEQVLNEIPSVLNGSQRYWSLAEVDLWLRFGKLRKTTHPRRLIRAHREELERFGLLNGPARVHDGAPGPPTLTYWLTAAQAILYCTISKGPRAACVRTAVIAAATADTSALAGTSAE